MGTFIDMTGQKFGRLTVLYRAPNRGTSSTWVCKCECGNDKTIYSSALRQGLTNSCGCLHKESITKHGQSKSPIYKTWEMMKQRCLNPNYDKYQWYGGRGIGLDEKWLTFEGFIADMGERPEGMTLDRIDNDKGYLKDNCRWVSRKDQAINRRSNLSEEERNKRGIGNRVLGGLIEKDEVFGRLTVLQNEKDLCSVNRNLRKLLCECSCGALKCVTVTALLAKQTQSCGCLHRDVVRQNTPGPAGRYIKRTQPYEVKI